MPLDRLPKDGLSCQYQQAVNSGDFVPSERVIDECRQVKEIDARIETGGPHPVERLRQAAA